MSALSFGCVVLVKFLKSISRKRCLVKYYPPLLWGGGGKVRKMCIKQLISKVTELCSCSLCSFANWHACLVMRLQKESPASDFQILSIEDRGGVCLLVKRTKYKHGTKPKNEPQNYVLALQNYPFLYFSNQLIPTSRSLNQKTDVLMLLVLLCQYCTSAGNCSPAFTL